MSRRAVFRLVPARRFAGTRFGAFRSPRRGAGDEVAGVRPYRPGDRRTAIDWRATARLTAARGDDAFLVRDYFADQAPTVALVVDRRPTMGLYAPPFPWLDKAAAVRAVTDQLAAATAAERGELAYVEHGSGRALRLGPRNAASVLRVLERSPDRDVFDAGTGSLAASLELLARHAADFPAGTFVFIVSDFIFPPPTRTLARLRSLRWDVTPIVVQDPVWEQSFPQIGGVALEIVDPATGERGPLLLGRDEAARRAAANAARLERTLAAMRSLGFDPVVVGSADPEAVAISFGHWARRRRALRRRTA